MRTEKILCPVDFSDCSKDALRTAIDLARDSGGSLMLIHVVTPTFAAMAEASFCSADLVMILQNNAGKALQAWRAQAIEGGAKTVDTVCVVGIAWDEIVKSARSQRCDLVVMGTHGRSGLKHVLLGSVAENVVRHAPCSVLIVRKP